MGRDSEELERSTLPDGPDTEPSDPLSDTMTSGSEAVSSGSEEVLVSMESSVLPQAIRTASDPARSLAATARSAENTRVRAPSEEQNSHTTQQSMRKPDVKMSGVPHSRRFLSIENDLAQVDAALRLLEKGLISAQKEARIAWILAAIAVLTAALAAAI